MPIIQSRLCWLALNRAGVLGTSCIFSQLIIVINYTLAVPHYQSILMGAASLQRYELTNALLEEFDSATLWDGYGIDADIIPFMRDFPHADIHELLSSDLLHQAIKGTFKDHLVEWVGAYLEIKYKKAEAEQIMDEVDQRYISSGSGFNV